MFWDFKNGKLVKRLRAHREVVINHVWLPHESVSSISTCSFRFFESRCLRSCTDALPLAACFGITVEGHHCLVGRNDEALGTSRSPFSRRVSSSSAFADLSPPSLPCFSPRRTRGYFLPLVSTSSSCIYVFSCRFQLSRGLLLRKNGGRGRRSGRSTSALRERRMQNDYGT